MVSLSSPGCKVPHKTERMAFDPTSSSPKPVSRSSRLNLLKNHGPRFYRFHQKFGKMGGYETINRRYSSFILRLNILVISADLFYTKISIAM